MYNINISRYANFVTEFPVKYYDAHDKHILPWKNLIYHRNYNNYHKTCLTGSLWLAPWRLLIPGYPERNGNTKPSRWYKMLTLFVNRNLIFFIFILCFMRITHTTRYRNTFDFGTFYFVKYHEENFLVIRNHNI